MKIAAYRLGIELTQRCNLDCRHCFRGVKRNIDITKEIIEKIFDEVKYAHILDLSGGEVFLGYEQLKMVLEIAKEKGCIIENCSIIANGTIYDKRIYDLLDDYFGRYYQVGISNDDFHEKSICRIYGNDENAMKKIINNNLKHLNNPHCIGYVGLSKHLIDNGRATLLDTPKKKFEALGYYYSIADDICFAGPMIFIGADGYISDINSDIEKRNEQSIGNINTSTILASLLSGGIRIPSDESSPFGFFRNRDDEFATHQGDHLIFENNKMAYTTYEPDTKYWEAVSHLKEDLANFKKALETGTIDEFFANWDPIYDGDLSQIEHSKLEYKP